jgi:benzoyl-CoA reductase/2-hydroxyglutaryl-CoA dehydratase subunit BcrC/BadD/HgdB
MEIAKARKTLEAGIELSQIIKNFYLAGHNAKREGKKVAWVDANFPVEILYAFDIKPLYPENYATVCAAKRTGGKYCAIAEGHGYSGNLCSYARIMLGYLLAGETGESAPYGGLAAPDLLVTATALCDTRIKWFEIMSGQLGKPLFVLDRPYNPASLRGEVDNRLVEYYVTQLKELIAFLEQTTGSRLKYEKLEEVAQLSYDAYELFDRVLASRKKIPSPMSAADGFAAIFPQMYMAGTVAAVEFYRKLDQEVQERLASGRGVVPEEKYRLLWNGIPFWYNMGLLNVFDPTGGVIVAETTYYQPYRTRDPDPLRELAKKYLWFGCEGVCYWIDLALYFVQEYRIDGVVLSYTPCCRPLYIPQLEIKNTLKQSGIPVLVLDNDMADERTYAAGQIKTRVEAFIEIMQRVKK